MAYEYDVFISYKSGKIYGRWVLEVFYDFFQENLDQSLGRESNIFIDKSEINDGAVWSAKIKNALATSKCVVAVLSPLYFQSEWCKRECAAILYRQEQLGMGTLESPDGLLSGVILHDGEKFPSLIQGVQTRKWHDYAVVGKGFENTETFIRFQHEIRDYAENVAAIVNLAPPYENEWMKEEWLDHPYKNYSFSLTQSNNSPPVL